MTWLYFPHFQLDVPIEPFTWCDWTDEALVKKVVINISLELKNDVNVEHSDIAQLGRAVSKTRAWELEQFISAFGKEICNSFKCVAVKIEFVNKARLCVQYVDLLGIRKSVDLNRLVDRL